jgi:peptidoglycan hydrolase-like protein with peptidoglycan-binding domain
MQKLTALLAAGFLLAGVSGAMAASPAAAGTSTPAATSHSHHGMSSKHVKAVQAALNQNGAQLNVDGHWGPKTRSALMEFQQKNGLKATGHTDKATLAKLNVM